MQLLMAPWTFKGRLAGRVFLAVLALLNPAASQTTLWLGFNYIHGSASSLSWGVETFSQFKLGVQDVNAQVFNSPINGVSYVLNFTDQDTQSSQTVALKGAISQITDSVRPVLGIVGTESYSAPAVATYASMANVPMVSPGSTLTNLVDKSNYPYFLRSVANDASQLKATAAFIGFMNWRRCATLTSNAMTLTSLLTALDALSVQYLSLVYQDMSMTPVPVAALNKLQDTLKLVMSAGHRIITLYTKTADMPSIVPAASAAGLFTPTYTWVMTEASATPAAVAIPQIVFVKNYLPSNPLYDAYVARWPSVSTAYNCTRDGQWNQTTGSPFYGADLYSPTIWDTDYSCYGDGAPDSWGMYGYDAAWLFAIAMKGLLIQGYTPTNTSFGPALRLALLATNFTGITGHIVFDQATQDRAADQAYYMSAINGTSQLFALSTAALAAGDPANGPGSWCVSPCVSLTTAIPWPYGTPTDGRGLDSFLSTAFSQAVIDEEASIQVQLSIRDSFGRIPCQADCAAGAANSTACAYCVSVLLNASAINLVGLEWATGLTLNPLQQLTQSTDLTGGKVSLTLPKGFAGRGNKDRLISLKVVQFGSVIGSALNVTLASLACLVGQYGPGRTTITGCNPCSPGTVAPNRGQTACDPCPAGQFMGQSGRATCNTCAAGTYAASPGASYCSACPRGTYGSATGMSQCTACPTGMTTSLVGGTVLDDCVCPMGYYRSKNLVLAANQSWPCLACPNGLTCAEGSDERYFLMTGRSLQSSNGTGVTPQVLPGYWTSADAPLDAYLCKANADLCLGGPPGTCGGGFVGIACARCPDTMFSMQGQCTQCPDPGARSFFFPILPLILSFAVAFGFYILGRGDFFVHDWNKPQGALGILGTLFARHAQVIGLYGVLNLNMPPQQVAVSNVFTRVLLPLSIFRAECQGLASFEASVAIGLLTPAYLGLVCVTVFFFGKLIGCFWKRAEVDAATMSAVFGNLVVGFFLSICTLALSLFQCYPNPNGTLAMTSNNDVMCNSSRWNGMVAASLIAVIIYCGGTFVVIGYVVIMAQKKLTDEDFRKRWKFLLADYRDRRVWWHLCQLMEGFLLNLAPVVFSTGSLQIYMVQTVLAAMAIGTEKFRPWRHLLINDLDGALRLFEVLYGSVLMRFAPNWNPDAEAGWGLFLVFFPYGICILVAAFKVSTIIQDHFCPGRHPHLVFATRMALPGAFTPTMSDNLEDFTTKSQEMVNQLAAKDFAEVFGNFSQHSLTELFQLFKVMSETERQCLKEACIIIQRSQFIGLAQLDEVEGSESNGETDLKLAAAQEADLDVHFNVDDCAEDTGLGEVPKRRLPAASVRDV